MNNPKDFEQGNCPACGVSWQGEPIAQEYIDKGYYGSGLTHYSRIIGIEYAWDSKNYYDGTSEYQCPDCEARFGRWTGKQLKDGEEEVRFGGA